MERFARHGQCDASVLQSRDAASHPTARGPFLSSGNRIDRLGFAGWEPQKTIRIYKNHIRHIRHIPLR